MKRSNRAKAARFSTTLAIDDKARKLKAEGVKLWGFGAGQPDFPTPEAISAAGIQAIKDGKTVYTSPQGTVELRRAICAKLQRDNGLKYVPDEIVVSAGAKQAIYMALAVLVDPGDEVLVPAPYWVSYPEMIQLLDGVPVILPTDESTGFKITPEQLAAAITPRTVAIILNTPSNPTGHRLRTLRAGGAGSRAGRARPAPHHRRDLRADPLRRGGACQPGRGEPEPARDDRRGQRRLQGVLHDRLAHRVPGGSARLGRSGRGHAEPPLGEPLQHLAGSDAGGAERRRRDGPRDGGDVRGGGGRGSWSSWREAPGLRVVPPKGAFYVFPDFSAYYGRSLDGAGKAVSGSQGMAEFLLDTARVVLVPGDAFGSDRHLRISFACAEPVIEEGLRSLVHALADLR